MPFSFNTSFSDINEGIFGTNVSGSQSQTGESSGYQIQSGGETLTSGLEIDVAGVNKTIQDLLKDPNIGLANIVGQDRAAGLYGSSAAAFTTNDLLDKIAGTIAQLTAKKVETRNVNLRQDQLTRSTQVAESRSKKKGLLGNLFSDARLKTNVMRIGTTPGGLPWYRYEFLGLIPEEGVLAQDLLILLPDAVERHESGYFMVDYSKVH